MIDTGADTDTGGRVKRLRPWLGDETFMLTYGDGLADVDLHQLLAFHRSHGKLATVTAVRPPARFGGLTFFGDLVTRFDEKPQIGEGWINGGFFVLGAGRDGLHRRRQLSFSSASRWSNLPATANWWPTVIKAFGNAWTRSATCVCWSGCGAKAPRRGERRRDAKKHECLVTNAKHDEANSSFVLRHSLDIRH